MGMFDEFQQKRGKILHNLGTRTTFNIFILVYFFNNIGYLQERHKTIYFTQSEGATAHLEPVFPVGQFPNLNTNKKSFFNSSDVCLLPPSNANFLG